MSTIEQFNAEKRRITMASLLGQPRDFSKLREIYAALPVVKEEFQYDEKEDDEKFWQRCQRFSQNLFK